MKLPSGEEVDADAVFSILQREARTDNTLDKSLALAIQEYRVNVRDNIIQQQQAIINELKESANGNDSEGSGRNVDSNSRATETQDIPRSEAQRGERLMGDICDAF